MYFFQIFCYIFTLTERESNVLFNDTLNTFYLRLYGIRHMVKDHSDSEKGNPLPPHRLLLSINSKGSFICTIHRQDNTYHSLCYTSRGALAGTITLTLHTVCIQIFIIFCVFPQIFYYIFALPLHTVTVYIYIYIIFCCFFPRYFVPLYVLESVATVDTSSIVTRSRH